MPRQKQVFLLGIASGMAFMQANQFIHRGLKPANVILDRARGPWIGDFWLSQFIERGATLSQSMQVGGIVHGAGDLRGRRLRLQG
jgi:serine/threonine protein kinase